MALEVGAPAPRFTLKSMQEGGLADVPLVDPAGAEHTVLLFFPAAFTGVCTQQLCDATGGLQQYRDLNARVLGLSPDTPFAQAAWAKQEKIEVTLLSDYQKEVVAAYGAELDDLAGLGKGSMRGAVVIDKEGIVRHAEFVPPLEMPSAEKVQEVLRGLA